MSDTTRRQHEQFRTQHEAMRARLLDHDRRELDSIKTKLLAARAEAAASEAPPKWPESYDGPTPRVQRRQVGAPNSVPLLYSAEPEAEVYRYLVHRDTTNRVVVDSFSGARIGVYSLAELEAVGPISKVLRANLQLLRECREPLELVMADRAVSTLGPIDETAGHWERHPMTGRWHHRPASKSEPGPNETTSQKSDSDFPVIGVQLHPAAHGEPSYAVFTLPASGVRVNLPAEGEGISVDFAIGLQTALRNLAGVDLPVPRILAQALSNRARGPARAWRIVTRETRRGPNPGVSRRLEKV